MIIDYNKDCISHFECKITILLNNKTIIISISVSKFVMNHFSSSIKTVLLILFRIDCKSVQK